MGVKLQISLFIKPLTMLSKFKKNHIKKRKLRSFNAGYIFNIILKTLSLICISGLIIITDLPLLHAFEAHVVNVTGQVCYKEGETRTIGYWKTHPDIAQNYLPLAVGNNNIETITKAIDVLNFSGSPNLIENKLSAQLLGIKLNILHYSINEYYVLSDSALVSDLIRFFEEEGKIEQSIWIMDYFGNSEGKLLAEIADRADEMLVENNEKFENEAMMKLLDSINNLHNDMNFCVPLPVSINEILPNPTGNDSEVMPNGEWVELYNYGPSDIDISGWHLYNRSFDKPVIISAANSDNNNDLADGGETIIREKEFLVVYINGAYDDWMDNAYRDLIGLYDDDIESGKLISYYSYRSASPENKSYAKIPDGIGSWQDPVPTPGMPNVPESIIESISGSEPATSSDSNEINNMSTQFLQKDILSPLSDDNSISNEVAGPDYPIQTDNTSDLPPEAIKPDNIPDPCINTASPDAEAFSQNTSLTPSNSSNDNESNIPDPGSANDSSIELTSAHNNETENNQTTAQNDNNVLQLAEIIDQPENPIYAGSNEDAAGNNCGDIAALPQATKNTTINPETEQNSQVQDVSSSESGMSDVDDPSSDENSGVVASDLTDNMKNEPIIDNNNVDTVSIDEDSDAIPNETATTSNSISEIANSDNLNNIDAGTIMSDDEATQINFDISQ